MEDYTEVFDTEETTQESFGEELGKAFVTGAVEGLGSIIAIVLTTLAITKLKEFKEK